MIAEERWAKALQENPGKAIFCMMLYKYGKHNKTLFDMSRESSRKLRLLLLGRFRERSLTETMHKYYWRSRPVQA